MDQVAMRLELDRKSVNASTIPTSHFSNTANYLYRQPLEKKRYTALQRWTEALESVHGAVVNKAPGANRGGSEQIGAGDGYADARWM